MLKYTFYVITVKNRTINRSKIGHEKQDFFIYKYVNVHKELLKKKEQ